MTSDRFHDLFGGPPRMPEDRITQRDMDLAASIQEVSEDVVLNAVRHVHRSTGSQNLVMAGGVALNCVVNGRVLREGPFQRLWIQPAAGDAGGSLGSALLFWHRNLGRPRTPAKPDGQKGSLLGPSFDNEDIQLFLESVGADFEYIPDEAELLDRVARLIDGEKIIGWFHGRMEFGPRALGCRSIIGDARSTAMQQKMNVKIKFRESFRPFAPCVLREHAHEVFEVQRDEDSPYMMQVAPVREGLRNSLSRDDLERMRDPDLRVRVSVPRSSLPAITHVDYSARLQTVDPERHGRFRRLMERFHALTGCPVVVNTSFNIRGEPIVCTPEDAYRCFLATDMDCLVLENYLLLKEGQAFTMLPDIARYRQKYAEALD
jgi:carbamoyltransferase